MKNSFEEQKQWQENREVKYEIQKYLERRKRLFSYWKDQVNAITNEKDWLERLQKADIIFLETLIENFVSSKISLEVLIDYFGQLIEKQNKELLKNTKINQYQKATDLMKLLIRKK